MSLQKRMALLRKFVEDAGLTLDCYVSGVANRVTCIAIADDGESMRFALSLREGDMHADMNERSRIRRFAQMHSPKQPKKEVPHEIPGSPSSVESARVMDALDKLPRPHEPASTPFHPSAPIAWAPEPQPEPVETLMAGKIATKQTVPKGSNKPARIGVVVGLRVAAWLESKDTTQFENYSLVCDALHAEAKILVTGAMMREIMDELGKKLKEKPKAAPPKTYSPGNIILARNLVRLMTKLGEQPDNELLAMLKE